MLDGLQAILEKDPVVSTVNADDLMNRPSKVEADYLRHVHTFVPMGDVSEYSRKLAKQVTSGKTPKGMIVAPYGYGKTSTLAFLWYECERQGLLALPPFYCASLLDILKATYGWVKYRLSKTEPALIRDLEEIYRKYAAVTLEEMAKHYAQEHGLSAHTAIGLLQDMEAAGSLVLELTPANLLFFLDAAAALVGRAGYKGLVLLPDEFQQYFSKSANLKRIIQELREFVWGLKTRSNSLGVIFSVPTYAESIVQEQGQDVLHRLKEDGLYYRLQDIYTVDFPSKLWERYADSFELGQVATKVMGPYTLRAIGQVSARDDLGEGPRTVIDSFKRAILHYQDHEQPYTPLALIEDFLESNISFQAQTNKLKTVTRQALDSAVANTPERRQAIKLMAAFPEGCPIEVQKEYRLHDTINALSKQAHGELMTHRVDGYTLLGLSRTGGPMHIVDLMVTSFWRIFDEDDLHLEAAMRAFKDRLLVRLFERRRGPGAVGWGELNFEPTPYGSEVAIAEGTFNPSYPQRFLALQLGKHESQLQAVVSEADLQFDLLFSIADLAGKGEIVILSERHIRFELNLRQPVGQPMPQDLKKLEDFVNPQYVTPLLMLSLVDYFQRWPEIEGRPIPEADKAEINSFAGRLLNHSVDELFNAVMAETIQPPLRRVGRQMLEEVFGRQCRRLFSQYKTFMVHSQYQGLFNDYMQALLSMTLKERRGHAPLKGTKEELARRFGLTSVATFNNRIDSEYAEVMERGEWSGRGDEAIAEVRLKLHPLEETILHHLQHSTEERVFDGRMWPRLKGETIAELARDLGYRDDETLLALKLLAARGLIRIDQDDKSIYWSQLGPDPGELNSRLQKLADDMKQISELLERKELERLETDLTAAYASLQAALGNEEELDEIQTVISNVSQRFDELLSKQRDTLRGQLNNMLLEVERTMVELRQTDTVDREIQGQVAFVMHLNELRQRLAAERRNLVKKAGELKQRITVTLQDTVSEPTAKTRQFHQAVLSSEQAAKELQEAREGLRDRVGALEQWMRLLRDTDQLFNALAQAPDLRERLTQHVIPEIQVHLTKRKSDGLADWEVFRAKVHTIDEELEQRRRHGNEAFTNVKETYEKLLRDIKVDDFRPRTRYTYGEDEGSYNDLYEEVRSKIATRLGQIEGELTRQQSELLQAKFINIVSADNQASVRQVEQQLLRSQEELKHLSRVLTSTLISKAGEELTAFGQRVGGLADSINEVRKTLLPLLAADHQLTPEEVQIIQQIGSRTDMDLTELFVNWYQLAERGTLTELMQLIESLYRKRRLSVRVRSRG